MQDDALFSKDQENEEDAMRSVIVALCECRRYNAGRQHRAECATEKRGTHEVFLQEDTFCYYR